MAEVREGPLVYPTAQIRDMLYAVAADPGLSPAARARELRLVRDELKGLAGQAETLMGDAQVEEEALAVTRARGIAEARENADIRDEMLRRGLATPEHLEALGYLSHAELDRRQGDGTVDAGIREARQAREDALRDPLDIEEAVGRGGTAIRWDPNAHPRDREGQFKGVLGRLKPGQSVEFPDGTNVTKEEQGGKFRVRGPKPGAGLGQSEATKRALDSSAAKKDERSLGGAHPYDSHADVPKDGVAPRALGAGDPPTAKIGDLKPTTPAGEELAKALRGKTSLGEIQAVTATVDVPALSPEEAEALDKVVRDAENADHKKRAGTGRVAIPPPGAPQPAPPPPAADAPVPDPNVPDPNDPAPADDALTPEDQAGDEPIDVGADVNRAADLLAQGKKVQLDQPREVSVLLKELVVRVQEAKAQGEAAPDFDLCKVTVKNTNLFCAESQGIPRVQMPQLKGKPTPGSRADGMERDARGEVDLSDGFRASLEEEGVPIADETEAASYLRASQIELNGAKTAGMTKFLDDGGVFAKGSLFVSRDNYIVDGHHRWAATIGHDLEDGTLGDVDMDVSRVDLGIIDLLDRAKAYAADWGIPQADSAGGFGTGV